ncbi:MAG TPA: enoyl-CoA hydratase/isomerase family protein, partial [Candidatus Deferrimicrobiaceae bacterium]|nr:enoyl-CoA hydratase/isomerase family protein [Candidatus Deferrimicrobiaceae bacterium]
AEARNALSRAVADALEAALARLPALDRIRAVVVAGRGRSFCAGADIAEMPTLAPAEAETLAGRWQRIMDAFAALPQVTIAAVQGHALGGGLMLAIAQDLRVAEASARFGLPEVTLGFNPGYGIARLLDVAGGAHARDLMLTARTVDAAEAHRMGLVTRVVRDGALEATALELAREVARSPRGGLAATKAITADLRAGRAGSEPRAYGALRAAPDAQARIAAFLNRRRIP